MRTTIVRRTLTLVCLLIAACARHDSIEGEFVGRSGAVPVSFHDGHFHSPAIGDGSYFVSGNAIALKLASGKQLMGIRIDADNIRLNQIDGVTAPTPLELTRVTAKSASLSTRSLVADQQAPAPLPASPPVLVPDPSIPLSSYTALQTQIDAGMVYEAFRQPDIPDDALLDALAPNYRGENDGFKKRDIAATQLPKLRAGIEQAKGKRYYTVPLFTHVPGPVYFPHLELNAYDFKTQSFLLLFAPSCWTQRPIDLVLVHGMFAVIQATPSCAIPIADESLAKHIEDLRVRQRLTIGGELGFFIMGSMSLGRVNVAVTHAHVILSDSRDSSFHYTVDL